MSDVAAVSLGEWFLADSRGRSNETLAETLRGDPPLALWVALKADCLPSAAPRSVADLAALLAVHGLAWLQWDADPAVAEIDAGSREDVAARVAVAVVASELAAESAALESEAASRQAQLLGLLQDPAHWLSALKRTGSGQSSIRPPKWLAPKHFDPTAVRAVEQAVGSIGVSSWSSSSAGVQPVLPGELAVSPAILRRGLDAASRWAAAQRAARWLPPLMAKLARLSVLERSLRETVEAEKIAAMAEFAAGAGHEINNPLAVIAGRAQLLLRDEADPERRRDLAVMNAQAMRVNEMIADLRLFATPPELERQPLDLTALVRGLIDEMQPMAAGQETTVRLAEGSSAVRIEADPVQLIVAMRSLCQNALEALGHGGRIEISVIRDGDEASITVSDDGPGISTQQRQHIFEPFYSARQAGRGLGMGLSKCWRIVTQHGGRIVVGNRAGPGAVFTIRLPLSGAENG
ncbi:MAG: sensor histidine kinase [Thermoguttaceae bacterium]